MRGSRPVILLGLGVAAGALLAAWGILETDTTVGTSLPATAVARVNGQIIRLDDYQRAVNGLAQDRRSGVDTEQRRLVLDRLIDDELLLQRALDLGLAHDDLRVRRALTTAVIESVLANQESVTASDEELRAFYDSDRDFFTTPGQVRVRQIWFRAANPSEVAAAQKRAEDAVTQLRQGEDFQTVKATLGDKELAPLPDVLLPAIKLGDYLGPTAVRTALEQSPGTVSDPIRSTTGFHVLQVVERTAPAPPRFEAIKPQVLAEFRRRHADQSLRKYLDDLRRHAQVEIVPDLP